MKKVKPNLKVRNSVEAAALLIPEFVIVTEKWRREAKRLSELYPEFREYDRLQWRLFTLLGRMATMVHMPWLKLLVDEFGNLVERNVTQGSEIDTMNIHRE